MLVNNCTDVSSYSPSDISFGSRLSFGHVAWKSRHMGKFLIASSMLVFMLNQYTDSLASSHVFSMPILYTFSFLVLYLAVTQVLLFFCLSWQFHLWSEFHLWMTSMAEVPSIPQLLSVASCGVQVLRGCVCLSPNVANLVILLSCSLVCPCITLLHLWWCTCLVFLHLCVFHGHVWIANIWWIVIALVCTVFLCCTDEFVIVFFEAFVIGLQHISWRLPPVAFGLWSCWH